MRVAMEWDRAVGQRLATNGNIATLAIGVVIINVFSFVVT